MPWRYGNVCDTQAGFHFIGWHLCCPLKIHKKCCLCKMTGASPLTLPCVSPWNNFLNKTLMGCACIKYSILCTYLIAYKCPPPILWLAPLYLRSFIFIFIKRAWWQHCYYGGRGKRVTVRISNEAECPMCIKARTCALNRSFVLYL